MVFGTYKLCIKLSEWKYTVSVLRITFLRNWLVTCVKCSLEMNVVVSCIAMIDVLRYSM